jgi:DNA-binding NtrC family response regulator
VAERIVVVEDDRELRDFLAEALVEAGYEVSPFPGVELALRALGAGQPADLILTDLIMPGLRGHDLLREVRARWPELNVVVLTAFGSIDSAIELVKAGAYDYLTKPVAIDDLTSAVERALVESRGRRERAREARAATVMPPPGFVATSAQMQEVLQLVARVAPSPHPVLITGESGTGKELVARALHAASGRGAFVAINCGAMPDTLLESELFGHERGAFTGADRDRRGLFEAAHGGTLFLDELAELPPALQPKLLRALESGEVRRVGATTARTFDVRIIAATNRDLDEEMRQGRFRDDLYWRLHVLHIDLPPLRERPADIIPIAEQALHAAGRDPAPRLAAETADLLVGYSWPGNARELRNAMLRAAALAVGDEIRPADLPPRIRDAAQTAALVARASHQQLPLAEVERAYILEVLRQAEGNKSRAAAILGVDRKTLYRKLSEYGTDGEDTG